MDRELEQLLKEMTSELKDLTRVLRGSAKTAIQNTKSTEAEIKARKMIIKMMEDQKKQLKARGKLTKEFSKELDESIDAMNKFQKKAKGFSIGLGLVTKAVKFLKDAIVSVATAGIKTALAFSDTTKSISSVEDLIKSGFGEIPVVGQALNFLARDIDSNVEAFTQLAKTGATFGSSIVMLRRASADAVMPLTKFTDLIGTNSGLLAKLFGTVDQGIPQITGLTRSLRDITENEFAKFGLTLDDTSGFLTTFLELERARGNVSRMSQAQLLQGTADYTKNLVTLSKLTGESVDTLNQQNMALAADGVFQSQLAGMNAKDAKTLSLGLASLPGPLAQLGKEFIGLGAPISETSRELEAISGGRFGDAFKAFEQTGDLVAFNNSIKTISADVMQSSKAFGQASLAGGGFGEALNAVVQSIGKAVDPSVIQNELDAVGDNIKNLRNITSTFDRVASKLEIDRFELLAPMLYDNSEATLDFTSKFNEKIKDLVSDGGGLDKFYNKLSSAVEYVKTGKLPTFTGDKDNKKATVPGSAGDISGEASMEPFYNGSSGFKDFGSGTPAMLHGVEAVVPKNDIGQLAGLLAEVGATTTTNTTAGDTVTNNSTNMDMTILNNNTTELIDLNKKLAQHLNTLVTIGAMTEKNTKSTNNSLANMGGSLV
jgi:voltage-gated potassium channel Kch